jgi:hypothetical protein
MCVHSVTGVGCSELFKKLQELLHYNDEDLESKWRNRLARNIQTIGLEEESTKDKVSNDQDTEEYYCACALEAEIVERMEGDSQEDADSTSTALVCFVLLHHASCKESDEEHMYSGAEETSDEYDFGSENELLLCAKQCTHSLDQIDDIFNECKS